MGDAANPASVRDAIRDAMNAIARVRGLMPANVAVPLAMAHDKLLAASRAVDAWSAQSRLSAIEQVDASSSNSSNS